MAPPIGPLADEGTEVAFAATVHAGLIALAEFIEWHPGLPLARFGSAPYRVGVYGHGSDEANRAEVDRIAAILGVTARWNEARTHYGAERDFGGGIAYEAWAITSAHRDAYARHMAGFDHAAGSVAA